MLPPDANDDDEAALLRRAQNGDVAAFNALVLAHQDRVFTSAYRVLNDDALAADAAQQAFLAAWRQLPRYRGGSFRGWLARIVTNTSLDMLRHARRRPASSLDAWAAATDADAPPVPSDAPTPEQALLDSELAAAIQGCMAALGPDQRAALVLCDVDGQSYAEIAVALGVALGTVRSRISRARAAMRDCLSAVRELLPDVYRLSLDRER